jgi:hypothetical protein
MDTVNYVISLPRIPYVCMDIDSCTLQIQRNQRPSERKNTSKGSLLHVLNKDLIHNPSDTACFYTGCSIPTVIKKIRPPVGMFVFIGRKQHDQAHTHTHKHRNARTHGHTHTLPTTLLRHSQFLHRLLNSDSHQEDQTARRYVCLHKKNAA